jgi:hypothetical protein
MEKESSRKETLPFIPIPVPLLVPVSPGFFDEWLTRTWPQEYRGSFAHLQNAQIEVLKAVDAAVSKRIESLEKHQKEAKPQKEKVQVK